MRTQGVMETGEERKGVPGTQLCACVRGGEEVGGNNGLPCVWCRRGLVLLMQSNS